MVKIWIKGLPSGKLTVCYGKSPSLTDKSTMNVPCSIAMLNNRRVYKQQRLQIWSTQNRGKLGLNFAKRMLSKMAFLSSVRRA